MNYICESKLGERFPYAGGKERGSKTGIFIGRTPGGKRWTAMEFSLRVKRGAPGEERWWRSLTLKFKL
jgi:hypothetical protein